jgi:hypothetical protein
MHTHSSGLSESSMNIRYLCPWNSCIHELTNNTCFDMCVPWLNQHRRLSGNHRWLSALESRQRFGRSAFPHPRSFTHKISQDIAFFPSTFFGLVFANPTLTLQVFRQHLTSGRFWSPLPSSRYLLNLLTYFLSLTGQLQR